MKRPSLVAIGFILSFAFSILPSYGARTISENTVLSGDADWSGDGVVTVNEGVTLDLAGHKLTVAGLAGAGTVTSSVAAVYHRLEYLESAGPSYINTGYVPKSDTVADLRLRFTGNLPASNGSWKSVFGSRAFVGNETCFALFLYRHSDGKVYFWRSFKGEGDAKSAVVAGNVVTLGKDYYIRLDKDGTSCINGGQIGSGLAGDCAYSALLFAENENGENAPFSGTSGGAGQRLYYCRFTEGDATVHDFVPAKRLSDGALGMYDRTTGDFKTNAGGGSFTGGAEVSERAFATGELHLAAGGVGTWNCAQLKVASDVAVVADGGLLAADADWRALGTIFTTAGESIVLDGHTLKVSGIDGEGVVTDGASNEFLDLDYIEGSGTQYINTGYVMGPDTTVDFKAQFTVLPPNSGWQGVFGWRDFDASGPVAGCMALFLHGNAGTCNFWRTMDTESGLPGLGAVVTGTDYTFHLDKTGNVASTVTGGSFDGAELGTAVAGTCQSSAFIFSVNHQGSVWSANGGAKMRLYYLTFSENGVVTRRYVPVSRISDNAIGLYDRVGHQFYANNGSGAFLAGPVSSSPSGSAGGELHLDIPEGRECENRDVSIQGNLKLVKEGAGTFIPAKGMQLYTGGTLIAAGEIRCTGTNIGDYPNGSFFYGAAGGEVTVAAGAVMDFDGTANHRDMYFVLDGGEIRSDIDRGQSEWSWIGHLRLTADSRISGFGCGFINADWKAMTVDLAGHELTVAVPADKYFYVCNTTFTGGGRMVADGGGYVQIGGPCTFASGTTFEVRGAALYVQQSPTMAGTYESNGTNPHDQGAETLQITGRFKPGTSQFHSVLMKNGSTLDLNGISGLFTSPCDFESTQNQGVLSFESGATVTVDISGRTPVFGERLIAWPRRPVDVAIVFDATTTAANVPAVIAADGLYYGCDLDSRVVDQAWWTGAAGDGSITNAANWACTNAMGRVVEDALPGSHADVHVKGAVAIDVLKGQTLEFHNLDVDGARLVADCDWRGLGSTALEGTIDLNGHGLTLSDLKGGATITDTSKGYVALNYLQNPNGNQYIDTGVCHDATTKADLKVQFGGFPTAGQWYGYFGARLNGDGSKSLSIWVHNNAGTMYHWQAVTPTEGDATSLGPVDSSTIYNVHLEKSGVCTINGEGFATSTGGGTGASSLLFAVRHSNTRYTSQLVKIYSCKIEQNGTLERDFVPAKRISDGVLGMYDKVHDQFYTNAGSGTFNAGVLAYDEHFIGGTLTVEVPEGETVTASSVNITGGVKLVKQGAGTLIAAKGGQTYVGGNLVADGLLKFGNNTALGEATEVVVGSGAVLELNGVYDLYKYIFTMDGGTLQNTTTDRGVNLAQMATMRLTADSTFNPTCSYGFINSGYTPTSLDLGGYVLSVDVGVNKDFRLINTTVENGRIDLKSGGWTRIGKQDSPGVDARTADFRVNSALSVISPFSVRDYEADYNYNNNEGTAAMEVYGRFKPSCAYFYGCTLQDGATLDLTAQSGTWSTTSAFTAGANQVTFADDAHITIGVSGRTMPPGGKIVDWTDNTPENLESLTFTLDAASRRQGWHLLVRDDGIYVEGGLVILIR